MQEIEVGIGDSETITTQLHLILTLLPRNVENRTSALADIACDSQKERALSDSRFSANEDERPRNDASSKDPVDFLSFEENAGMGARSDFAQLQGMRSFAGRATALYGWSRNLLGDGIPAVTRITLSLPLGILLSTLATDKRRIREPSSLK